MRGRTVRLLAILAAAVLPSAGAADRSQEDDIFEAVFRQQVSELLDAEALARGVVLCLAVDPGDAPQSLGRDLRDRLKAASPSIRGAAECEVGAGRAREIATGRSAILVTAGPIDPVKADEVWVTVTQRWSRVRSYRREYRVVREPARWISLGPIFKGSPA